MEYKKNNGGNIEMLSKNVVMVGFGSIGQATLPFLINTLKIPSDRIHIITADASGAKLAKHYGIDLKIHTLTPHNYESILKPLLKDGGVLLNLSVNVSSFALVKMCHKLNALYLDTCIEPWEGRYTDKSISIQKRSNYALREEALAMRKKLKDGPTALLAHGMNPGLISHFLKQALVNVANDTNVSFSAPKTQEDWAHLAAKLNVKAIHVAEQDMQITAKKRQEHEFVNTWSVDGFLSEGQQPAELGWGTHEKYFPKDGKRHPTGCKAAIYLQQPGLATNTRSWTPQYGPYQGFLITHNESISTADYLTVKKDGEVKYRPTVYYSYRPANDAILSIHEMEGNNFQSPQSKRILNDEITSGVDELGILLMGHKKGAYWYGSQLDIHEARKLAPHCNATALQVVAGILCGLDWMIRHPRKGIVEPENIDYDEALKVAMPYLGKMGGHYSDWTPLKNLSHLFPWDVDAQDPWQFKNFRIS
ncbi:MAG: saccharopine dehydrogenase C-terminal domain-containing protein [Alphaproteobacteria bacterium]